MKRYELDQCDGVDISLRPGMAWMLYTDSGPSGPCGQSMRVTCSHAVLHVFDNENLMREWLATNEVGRNTKRNQVWRGVVGQWCDNAFTIIKHSEMGGAS